MDVERRRLIADTWVSLFTTASLLDTMAEAVRRSERVLLVHHNVNSMALHQREFALRSLYRRADACFVDGTPILWIGRLLGEEMGGAQRLGVLDWIWPALARAEDEGWRVAHIGGTPEVAARASAVIHTRHPRLAYAAHDGYFDTEPGSVENEALLASLQRWRPDVVLVGMGMPLQERWVLENYDRLPTCAVVTVGGVMGYIAGERPTAPRWLGPLGLEWLYRLATEPRRLASRYLVEPWVLPLPLAREAVLRRFRRNAGRPRAARTRAIGNQRAIGLLADAPRRQR